MAHTNYRFRVVLWCVVLLVLLAVGAFFIKPASSQMRCDDYNDMHSALRKSFKEVSRGVGLVNAENAIQLMVSPDGSTFTILVVQPDGKACILAAGTFWEDVAPPLPGKPT